MLPAQSVDRPSPGMTRDLDYISAVSIVLSGVLIFTTIQAQDFADVEGDSALGRVTFPIYAPELARAFTLLALVAWSWGLSAFWEIGPLYGAAVTVAGAVVGWRYYALRTPAEDKRSYVLYNVRGASSRSVLVGRLLLTRRLPRSGLPWRTYCPSTHAPAYSISDVCFHVDLDSRIRLLSKTSVFVRDVLRCDVFRSST